MRTDEEAVTDIKANLKISTFKREREREKELSRLLKGRHSNEGNAELEIVLEAELEQAQKLNKLLIPLHGEPVYHRLLQYHRKCSAVVCSLTADFSWFSSFASRWVWFQCDDCVHHPLS